ncbi:MAG: hypothetical protein A3F84_22775 [Candidatus Handelsmanbacteria bacterium RIFCSPLOWO2_12_FULL_64_10]|uniref:Sulfatase N-terminal domain-containing protein n=1 Tax=Handelsmanbacteria sp. (strain RIFCSPLOWO2_12_FULL_64_10) TaxID=1817868 RepID=A0A1F6CDQ7_HANXR|nr:MAG: hypothetical protein A3F84_22775 [Candidatus Handelsmanbacteria bacterium RIFCSPLOWO2_12_FULL_64_10]
MSQPVHKFLLISIDCWRYDALSRTHPRLNTPKFDALTEGFSLAERFFVTAPATRPSHTSLFTGLYPFEHGLYGQTYLKMFDGIPNLFRRFSEAGYHITGRSERPDVFRFLDFDRFIGPMDPAARDQHLGSLEDLLGTFALPEETPQFCFLHFFYTHGGYGMRGMPSAPNLRRMVAEGRTEEALRFYYAAAVHVQEFLLVEILKRVPLDRWAVFIFGDHGEGFCDEVMTHGERLHQNVVHVPLLAHAPGREGLTFPEGPVSMIDLFPTVSRLAGLRVDYRGYGRDLIEGVGRGGDRWVLTELDSLYGIGFLRPQYLDLKRDQITSRISVNHRELERDPEGARSWTITDGRRLYREEERTGEFVLRDVMSGEDLPCDDPGPFRAIREGILSGSAYQGLQTQESTSEEAKILEERLRALGYIA